MKKFDLLSKVLFFQNYSFYEANEPVECPDNLLYIKYSQSGVISGGIVSSPSLLVENIALTSHNTKERLELFTELQKCPKVIFVRNFENAQTN